MRTVVCVHWGDKYPQSLIDRLKEEVERFNCVDNFIALTDNPTRHFHRELPTPWDEHENGNFWAFRKLYAFADGTLPGNEFLYLDLDVHIHHGLEDFFQLPMDDPWIVQGYWNDPDLAKKNYASYQSTPINSSVIRWNKGQLRPVFDHVDQHTETIFFTYPTIDNYFHHYDTTLKTPLKSHFFKTFPQGMTYSYYKGNSHPDDVTPHVYRPEINVCLYNSPHEAKHELYDRDKDRRVVDPVTAPLFI